MNDPFGLEPPRGDYVAYLNALQAGRIRSLAPLSATGTAPGDASDMESLLKRIAKISLPAPERTAPSQSEPAATVPSSVPSSVPGESPSERILRRAREANRRQAAGAISGLAGFAGFTLFVIGGATGRDWLIPLGMLIAVAGFSTASKSKGKKR